MKFLSVIIPSYNSELYLARCLDSLVFDTETLPLLDIIIVNDGSSDHTINIAKQYQKRFKNSIQVVDKPNGGHGSTINAGLKVAKGKYVKILDSDDWFNIFDFPKLIESLGDEDVDIVVTNYTREILYEKSERQFIFSTSPTREIFDLSDAVSEIDRPDFFFKFSMPAMTIRTDALRRVWGDGLLEKTFYVDQQFVAKVLECSKTYAVYPLDIYRHFIGRPDQSISSNGFFRHRKDHERVLKNLLSTYGNIKDSAVKIILKRQIALMINTHYNIYLNYPELTKTELKELTTFDKFIKVNYPEFSTPSRELTQKLRSPHFIIKNLIKRNTRNA